MEEILASIRRILNDDEVPAAPTAEEPAEAEDDVLILDETMMVATPEVPLDALHVEPLPVPRPEPAPVEPAAGPIAPPQPVIVTPKVEPPVAAAEVTPPVSYTEPKEPPAAAPDLLAPEAAAAAASSVDNLVRTLTAGRATQLYGGGPTLEDMVRAELRPLLKAWLDVYLPPMVERLVRAEMERVVGRFVP